MLSHFLFMLRYTSGACLSFIMLYKLSAFGPIIGTISQLDVLCPPPPHTMHLLPEITITSFIFLGLLNVKLQYVLLDHFIGYHFNLF